MNKNIKIGYRGNNIFVFVFVMIILFDFVDLPLVGFIIKSIYLTLYLLYNIFNYKKNNPNKWLLNPAILASIFTFLLGFSVTNYIYFISGSEENKLLYEKLGYVPFPVLNYVMTMVVASALAMWYGYYSNVGEKVYKFLLKKPLRLSRYFRNELNPNMAFIYTLIIISVFARLYAINLGIYGYAQSQRTLTDNLAIALIINSAGQLINFSLILISLKFFKEGFNFNYRITLAIIVLIEIYFGVISGVKSAVIFPVAILFICYYMVTGKFHRGFIVITFMLLIISYLVIEPYRIIRTRDVNFQSTPGYIVNTMVDAYSLNKSRKIVYGDENIFLSVLARNNYLITAAKAVDYADNSFIDKQAPDFLEKIYTVPLQAYIPRFLWRGKPIEDLGTWFSYVVWGGLETTAVAMTPIGFLYFAGGFIAIIIGFFVFGIMQKVVWNFFLGGGGQILLYFGFLSSVVLIDSSVNGTLVSWLRNLPIFIILQTFLLKK